MVKLSDIFELKNQPNWLVRIATIIVLIFVFSLLSAVASGAWNWLGIIIIFFIMHENRKLWMKLRGIQSLFF